MNCPGSSRQGNSRLPHPLRLPAVATKRVRLRRNTAHRFMGPRCKYLLCSSDATSVTNTGVCRSPTEWDIGQVFPIPEAPATSAPVLALGKRRREEPQGVVAPIDDQQMPPQKRGRGGQTEGILEATRSAARTRHEHVARIPTQVINNEPKEAGRGAERLATLDAQGIYANPRWDRVSSRGGRWKLKKGNLIERSGKVRHNDSMMQRQQQQLKERTSTSRSQGNSRRDTRHSSWLRKPTWQVRSRRSNASARLKTWEDYNRHCDTMEAHPFKISFGNLCGVFFARGTRLSGTAKRIRPSSVSRSRRRRPTTSPKRSEKCLKTGEDIGIRFSQIIKEKYPDSSKKCYSSGEGGSRLEGQ